jgi:hypothetical protein
MAEIIASGLQMDHSDPRSSSGSSGEERRERRGDHSDPRSSSGSSGEERRERRGGPGPGPSGEERRGVENENPEEGMQNPRSRGRNEDSRMDGQAGGKSNQGISIHTIQIDTNLVQNPAGLSHSSGVSSVRSVRSNKSNLTIEVPESPQGHNITSRVKNSVSREDLLAELRK